MHPIINMKKPRLISAIPDLFVEVVNLGGLSAKEFARRVAHEVWYDKCFSRAAQLAYYFFFALFPFFLFLTTLLGSLPVANPMRTVMGFLATFVSHDVLVLLQDNVEELVTQQTGGLLSIISIVTALWLSTSAVVAVGDVLNEGYGVTESRPFWKVWGEGLLLTISLSLLYIVSTVLLMFGPRIGAWLAYTLDLGYVFEFTWNIFRWPIALCFVNFTAAALYYFTPDVQQKWKWVTPGSIFSVFGWIIVSSIFAYYVNSFDSYNRTYGSIGTVIVLLTWLYLIGLFILIGGEINSEIEHASREGKDPGEKTV